MSDKLSEQLDKRFEDSRPLDFAERVQVRVEITALEQRVENALGTISMLEHHWISPMEYYEATKDYEARLSRMEKALDLERLATIEHTQWMAWARPVMDEEPGLSASRRDRWQAMMVDYSELPEEIKEYDREWARIVIGESDD